MSESEATRAAFQRSNSSIINEATKENSTPRVPTLKERGDNDGPSEEEASSTLSLDEDLAKVVRESEQDKLDKWQHKPKGLIQKPTSLKSKQTSKDKSDIGDMDAFEEDPMLREPLAPISERASPDTTLVNQEQSRSRAFDTLSFVGSPKGPAVNGSSNVENGDVEGTALAMRLLNYGSIPENEVPETTDAHNDFPTQAGATSLLNKSSTGIRIPASDQDVPHLHQSHSKDLAKSSSHLHLPHLPHLQSHSKAPDEQASTMKEAISLKGATLDAPDREADSRDTDLNAEEVAILENQQTCRQTRRSFCKCKCCCRKKKKTEESKTRECALEPKEKGQDDSSKAEKKGKKKKKLKNKDLISPEMLKLEADAAKFDGIEARRWRCSLKEHELAMLVQEIRDAAAAARWAKFDLFFGAFVVLNGLMIGVQADSRDMLPESQWTFIENGFLYVFIVELVLRTLLAGPRTMLKDVWTYFDTLIIGVSLLDTYYLSSQADLGSVTVLRIVRLFRLARLVRLFRLLKELWLLVMGLYISVRTVFWSLVMLSICLYVFAILLVGIVMENPSSIPRDVLQRWNTIPKAMWTLLKLATMDGWSEVIGAIVQAKPLALPFLLVFMGVTAIGVLNLIIGIMCQSAFIVTSQDDELQRCTKVVRLHNALLTLREALLEKLVPEHVPECERGNSHVSIEEICEVVNKDVYFHLAHRFEKAGLTVGKLHIAFQALSFGQKRRRYPIDSFIGACLWFDTQLRHRELDYLEVSVLLRRLNTELKEIEFRCMNAGLHLYWSLLKSRPWEDDAPVKDKHTIMHVIVLVKSFSKHLGIETEAFNEIEDEKTIAKRKAEEAEAASKDKSMTFNVGKSKSQVTKTSEKLGDQAAQELAHEQSAEMAEKVFGKFDSVFGIFLLINAALIGIETDDPRSDTTNATLWYALDFSFTLIFTIELILRLILFNQVYVENDASVFLGAFPHPKPLLQLPGAIRGGWGRFAMDPYGVSDLIIVGICLVDNCILHYVADNFDAKILLVARFVRMLKVGRIARMFKATGELFLLVKGFVTSLRTITWALLLLFLLLYVVSIIFVTIVHKFDFMFAADAPVTKEIFGSIPVSMSHLMRMTTFDGWAETIDVMQKEGYVFLALVIVMLMIMTGLGIMNLVIGIMCESAMQVTEALHERQRQMFKLSLKQALHEVKDRFSQVEEATSSSPKTLQHQHHQHSITRKQLAEALGDKKLLASFHKAQLQLCNVWAFFDRLTKVSAEDEACDSADLNDLVHACMKHGSALKTVDLVAAKVRLRSIEERFSRCTFFLQRIAGELYAAQILINVPGSSMGEQDHTSGKYLEIYRPHAEILVKDHEATVKACESELQTVLKRSPEGVCSQY